MALSELEKNILRTKGVGEALLSRFGEVGIGSKADLGTVGDAATLASLTGAPEEVARAPTASSVTVPAVYRLNPAPVEH